MLEPLPSFREAKADVVARFERAYLMRLLQLELGHLSNAARRAGLDRKNLWQLLKRHDLSAEDFKPARVTGAARAPG